jgi:hypothetical protein
MRKLILAAVCIAVISALGAFLLIAGSRLLHNTDDGGIPDGRVYSGNEEPYPYIPTQPPKEPTPGTPEPPPLEPD